MKKRVSKAFNKNLKSILLIVAIIAVGLGVMLVMISGNATDRDQVKTDQVEQQQEKREERQKAHKDDHPGVSDEALAIYNARVDDIADTGAVAQLTEAIDLRKNVGDYMVTLELAEDANSMQIVFNIEVYENEQTAVDEAINMYAQQLLAMIENADSVKWTYTLKKGNKTETVEGSMTKKQAGEQLKLDIDEYRETPEMVQTLLNSQKGIT